MCENYLQDITEKYLSRPGSSREQVPVFGKENASNNQIKPILKKPKGQPRQSANKENKVAN